MNPNSLPPLLSNKLPRVQAARTNYHYLQELALRVFGLSEKEVQLGLLLLQGLFYEQIAEQLFRSESSIKADARRIFAKANVKDRRSFEQHIHALIESI